MSVSLLNQKDLKQDEKKRAKTSDCLSLSCLSLFSPQLVNWIACNCNCASAPTFFPYFCLLTNTAVAIITVSHSNRGVLTSMHPYIHTSIRILIIPRCFFMKL